MAVALTAVLGLAVWLVGQPRLPVHIPFGAAIARPKAFFTRTEAEGLFLAPDGSLWHWGKGKPLWSDDSPIPRRAGSTNRWADVTAVTDSVVGIRPDGTLWTWGLVGAVPSDGTTNRLHGSPDAPIRLSPDAGWKSVTAGMGCFYAIRADGTLWAWGENTWGQLGLGRHGLRQSTPQQIGNATNWTMVRAGGGEVFALRTDGTMWNWGEDSAAVRHALRPERIGTGSDWVDMSAGSGCFFALKRDGSFWATGANAAAAFNLPENLGTNWVRCAKDVRPGSYAAGGSFLLLLEADGSVRAAGRDYQGFGVLGTGVPSSAMDASVSPDQTVPVSGLKNCRQVWTGGQCALALTADGTVWLWGRHFGEHRLSKMQRWEMKAGDHLRRHRVKTRLGLRWARPDIAAPPIPLFKLDGYRPE